MNTRADSLGERVATGVAAVGGRRLGPGLSLESPKTWLVVGLIAGAAPVVALGLGLETRYIVYGALALVLAAVLPYIVFATGPLDRLLWVGFVLSLQLELAWAPISSGFGKVAGPYGVLISPTLLAGLSIVAVRWLQGVFGSGERLQVERGFAIAALCFLASGLLSFVKTTSLRLSGFGTFEIVSLILTAIVACDQCSRRGGIVILRKGLFTLLLAQSVIILTEQVTGIQISLAHGINRSYSWGGGDLGRFAGTFGAPSVAATYITVALLFLFSRLFSEERATRATRLWWLFGIGFLALLASRTRSAWIALAIGLVGLGWRSYRSGTISRRVVGRLLVAALLAFVIAWPLVSKRLAEDHEGSAETRGNLVAVAMAMIKANPVSGVGLNTATSRVNLYAAAAGVGGWVFIVHNQFLLVAAETGIPGLIAFLFVIGVGIKAARRCMRSDDTLIRETGAVLFWSLMSMLWAFNLDHVSGCMTYFLIWFLIGAACGLDILRKREEAGIAPAATLA
jgi:O-antigen ligase